MQHGIARQAEDVVDAVVLAPGHGLGPSVVGISPEGEAGARPVPADAAHQVLEEGPDLGTRRGLAGAQENRHRLAALDVIDVDGQEAASVCPGQAFRAEYLRPLIERQVGGHQDRAPLVALAEDFERSSARDTWRHHYNTIRPHSSLGYRPPAPETILPNADGPTYAVDGLRLAHWTLLTKVETSCDRILIAGGANVEAEREQGPAV